LRKCSAARSSPATRCTSTAAWPSVPPRRRQRRCRAFRITWSASPTRGKNYSVARYADDAAKCVDDILSRGKQPVIVGGTGLYLNALLAGHGFAGGDKDGRYRAELESRWDKEGGEAMFVELRRIDPETAGNLHLNDKKRILRALEVYYETGKTMAQHNAETKLIPPRYDSVRIGLAYEDRDDMKRAIDLRVDKMVEAGSFRTRSRAMLRAYRYRYPVRTGVPAVRSDGPYVRVNGKVRTTVRYRYRYGTGTGRARAGRPDGTGPDVPYGERTTTVPSLPVPTYVRRTDGPPYRPYRSVGRPGRTRTPTDPYRTLTVNGLRLNRV